MAGIFGLRDVRAEQIVKTTVETTVGTRQYGYFAGGEVTGVSCTIDRLDFSNETVDVPGTLGQLTDARGRLAAVSNSNYGYFAGGFSPGNVCTIDRLDFSNETVDVPGTLQRLTEARQQLAGLSTKQTTETIRKLRIGEFDASGVVYSNYGYFVGGAVPNPASPPPVSTCAR